MGASEEAYHIIERALDKVMIRAGCPSEDSYGIAELIIRGQVPFFKATDFVDTAHEIDKRLEIFYDETANDFIQKIEDIISVPKHRKRLREIIDEKSSIRAMQRKFKDVDCPHPFKFVFDEERMTDGMLTTRACKVCDKGFN